VVPKVLNGRVLSFFDSAASTACVGAPVTTTLHALKLLKWVQTGQLTWYKPKQVGFKHCGTKGIGRVLSFLTQLLQLHEGRLGVQV
jgi:hypothetical protein